MTLDYGSFPYFSDCNLIFIIFQACVGSDDGGDDDNWSDG